MNPLIQLKKATSVFFAAFGLACFGLSPAVQAVSPAPDGGYGPPAYGVNNTAEGDNALLSLTSGTNNTALGAAALTDNTGNSNTATGSAALFKNTIGTDNTANGLAALYHNIDGTLNTAIGESALFKNDHGGANTAIGYQALYKNNSLAGSLNTAIGYQTLYNNNTGDFNTALGAGAGGNVTTASNVICIGHNVSGTNTSNACFIGNIYPNVQPVVGTDPDLVTINSNGRLGRANVSSRRYKHDIQPMDKASEVLFGLKPVSFRYNKEYDATQTLAFGLIAEDVAEVDPDLVGRNPKGQPESVRYEQVNAMLLNEFLKEHRKVENLKSDIQATVAQQQKEIAALIATVKEQAAQIQRVSTQLEASKPAQQVVNNP